jgi:flagellar motor switch protein FliG
MSTQSDPAGADISNLTRVQKLAILLMALGPDNAAHVLKNLDADELEAVSAQISRQPNVSEQVQLEVLREFSEAALHASTSSSRRTALQEAATGVLKTKPIYLDPSARGKSRTQDGNGKVG